MKKFIEKLVLVVPVMLLSLSLSSQDLDRECINGNSSAQNVIAAKISLFNTLQATLLANVQGIIQQESISNLGNMLSFENLASVISVANSLQDYDKQYDEVYATYCNDIIADLWAQSICVGSMTLNEYQEEMYDYLEEEKFTLIDDYASTMFNQELSFQSALLKINQDEEDWLNGVGLNFDNTNPAFDQLINNDLYWPVLSEDWQIDLRNPEAELSNVTGYAHARYNWDQFGVKDNYTFRGGPFVNENPQPYDLMGTLQFIFDNWSTIEVILQWLSENVTYDCHPSTASSVNNSSRIVPSSLTPDRPRKIYYHVKQKGIFGDFKATKTKIEGKAKLYKKKKNGSRYKKDRNNYTGIGYCTLQWNPCEEKPWPVDNNPHYYAGHHNLKKAKFLHPHPYALTIYRSTDFLTYNLYYNFQFTGEIIHALGTSTGCN